MNAIIPVAGMGTRLRPHTHTAPKVLLHVAGKPILGHILDELLSLGVTNITFVVGYLGAMVEDYIAARYPSIDARFVEQEKRLGLGHAIWLARDSHDGDEPLLIILGDTIFQADLREPLESGQSLIGVKDVDDPRRFGIVETAPDGAVRRLVEKPEKPATNLAIVGIYVIQNPARLFDCLGRLIRADQRTKDEFQLTDALEMMIQEGEVMRTFQVDGWLDCGKPETMLATNRVLLDLKEQTRADADAEAARRPNTIVVPPVSLATGARVENAIVGPYVSISDGAEVTNAVVTNSIISENAVVTNIILDASIVSNNARVQGQSVCLNVGDSSEISFE